MRIKKMIAAIGLVVVMATTSSGNVFGETLTNDTGNMSYPGYVTQASTSPVLVSITTDDPEQGSKAN